MGLGPHRFGGGGLGVIVVIGLALLFGVDPRALLGGGSVETAPAERSAGPAEPRADDADAKFSSAVLKMTEDAWGGIFQEQGARCSPPTLVLYDRGHQTGCGFGQSAMGPFYCPADRRSISTSPSSRSCRAASARRGGSPRPMCIAHEVGHHVQNLEGTSEKVQAASQRLSKREANQLSVRTELQADCYAGVWAKRDERPQAVPRAGRRRPGPGARPRRSATTPCSEETQGRVVPDAFTHGTSEQRTRWFEQRLRKRQSRRLRHLRGVVRAVGCLISGLGGRGTARRRWLGEELIIAAASGWAPCRVGRPRGGSRR